MSPWINQAPPEEPPHRSKKDRRRWCKGKVGVEHKPVIKLDKYWASYYMNRPESAICGWQIWYYGDKPKPDWHCGHRMFCDTCGKVLIFSLPDDNCPHYRALPDIDQLACRCRHGHDRHQRFGGPCKEPTCKCWRFYWTDRDVSNRT